MDSRELKALDIAARMRLTFQNGAWMVPSSSGAGTYRVVLNPERHTCTCPNFELTGKDCKHIIAALFVAERDYGGKPLLIDPTPPKKKTYKQDWPTYTEAQTTEKKRLLRLLADRCDGIEEPERPRKPGRKNLPLRDAAFAAVFKIYSTFSARRFMCDLEDTREKGYISRRIHHNSVNGYLEKDELTPVLHGLVTRSALPLRAVEVDFAIDSTGFTTSRFHRWYDHKYGAVRQSHDWVKAHFATGVKTNVVTGVRILDRDAGDSPQFVPLVQQTAETFRISEVSGDKAYSSVANLGVVAELGGTPFVAFKNNALPDRGGVWEKMLAYYLYRRDEFLGHYHKRSNAESTVHMIKSKFRDHVRSKTDTAMKNQVLCKFICHNLCCVIQSQCELGIEPVFWEDEPDEAPAILPMRRG